MRWAGARPTVCADSWRAGYKEQTANVELSNRAAAEFSINFLFSRTANFFCIFYNVLEWTWPDAVTSTIPDSSDGMVQCIKCWEMKLQRQSSSAWRIKSVLWLYILSSIRSTLYHVLSGAVRGNQVCLGFGFHLILVWTAETVVETLMFSPGLDLPL